MHAVFFRYCVWQEHTRKTKNKQHCSSPGMASAFLLAEGKGQQLQRNGHEFEDSRPQGKPKGLLESPLPSRYVPCAVTPYGSTVAVQQPPRSDYCCVSSQDSCTEEPDKARWRGCCYHRSQLSCRLCYLVLFFFFFIAQTLKTDDHKTLVCHFQN